MIGNPDLIRISEHALTRYCERRGWSPSHDMRCQAEGAIRDLLFRCADQSPPLRLSNAHGASRLYRVGAISFVLNAESNVLITVLTGGEAGCRSGQARNQRYRKARRARADHV